MDVRGTNKLAQLAAELREQVPPQFLPKQDATLRADFAIADAPVYEDAPESDAQGFSLEIAETVIDALTQQPVISAAVEDDNLNLDLEAGPEPSEHLFNVVETPGASDEFEQDEGVEAVHEEEAEKLRSRAFQAMDAVADGKDFESSVNGYQALGPWVNARADESAEKKRQKEDEKFTQSMLKKMLDDHLRWLDEQIERLDRDIAKTQSLLSFLEKGGKLEVDRNGQLVDKEAERILQERERRTGEKIDRNNSAAVQLALQRELEDMSAQRDDYKRERDRTQELIDSGRSLSEDDLRRELPSYSRREQDTATSAMDTENASKVRRAAGYGEGAISKLEEERNNSGFGDSGSNEFFPAQGTSVASSVNGRPFNAPDMSGQFASVRNAPEADEAAAPSPEQEAVPKPPQFKGFA